MVFLTARSLSRTRPRLGRLCQCAGPLTERAILMRSAVRPSAGAVGEKGVLWVKFWPWFCRGVDDCRCPKAKGSCLVCRRHEANGGLPLSLQRAMWPAWGSLSAMQCNRTLAHAHRSIRHPKLAKIAILRSEPCSFVPPLLGCMQSWEMVSAEAGRLCNRATPPPGSQPLGTVDPHARWNLLSRPFPGPIAAGQRGRGFSRPSLRARHARMTPQARRCRGTRPPFHLQRDEGAAIARASGRANMHVDVVGGQARQEVHGARHGR